MTVLKTFFRETTRSQQVQNKETSIDLIAFHDFDITNSPVNYFLEIIKM